MQKENEFLKRYFERHTPVKGPGKSHFPKARSSFRQRGTASLRDLLRDYSKFSSDEKFVAICIFSQHGFQAAKSLLFEELRSTNLSGIAGSALARIGGDAVQARLLRLLKRSSDQQVRWSVIYALSHLRHSMSPDSLVSTLITILGDSSEDPGFRATAAEGVRNALKDVDRRSRVFQHAIQALTAALEDKSPEVRFFSIFALGDLRVKTALKKLRRIALTDHAKCPGMWTVKREAKWAIREIIQRVARTAWRPGRGATRGLS